jgi:hypothetical protein
VALAARARVLEVHDLPGLPPADMGERLVDVVVTLSVASTVGG